jgi:hypothetical protein
MADLATRISDLAAAIRSKINAMVPRLLPQGGTAGQILAKVSANDYAVAWATPSGGGGGNTNIEGGNASSVAVSNIDGGGAAG